MSGDVQPRKRKDKKKKKDDLSIEEPRGTAAALGEGDIFMHSYQEHGTGGHTCAKVIFFALLAVLVTLIGLIILENRGLSELEANSVETRYSGVLEGWLEEGHDDDHHDEHTLELNHHDDDDEDDDHGDELGHDHDDDDDEDDDAEDQSHETEDNDDDEHDQDDDDDQNQSNEGDDEEQNQDNDDDEDQNQEDDDDEEQSQEDDDDERNQEDDDDDREVNDQDDDEDHEQNLETAEDEDEVEEYSYRRYYRSTDNEAKDVDDNDDDDDDFETTDDNNDDDQSAEKDNKDEDNQQNDSQENEDEEIDDNNDSQENDNDDESQFNKNDDEDEDDEDHDDHNDHDGDDEIELEHIEEEVFDEEVKTKAPSKAPEQSEVSSNEVSPVDADEDEIELLEPDESDELPEELPIPLPKGKPLVEVEDSTSTEKPQDTLADEEEYERQQEALRKEKEEASQGMWLKFVVGGALLVATQAVLRRATAPRENEDEVDTTREDTPLSDRRMTLITEPVPPPVTPKQQEVSRPVVQKEVVKQTPIVKSAPPPPEDEEEDVEIEEEEEEEIVIMKDDKSVAAEKNKELYSDEEEEEEEDMEEKEPPKPIVPVRELPKPTISKPVTPIKEPPKPLVKETPEKKEPPKVIEKEPTPEEEDDDVEIIEEEDIGEDLEEEEEEISDVDDAELLNRLEAKYGRLPEPERPGRQKDGGNSIDDLWPGEPSDAYWRDELDGAERDLRQGEWTSAAGRASAAVLSASARARYIVARALDASAEAKRDNNLLSKAIAAYLELLKMHEKLSDKKLLEVTDRALDRMKFRGNYMSTEPIYRLLIRRFPDDPNHRNNLTICFLMANRVDLAEDVIKETLKLWPNDRLSLAHYGFILKTRHNKQEEAVDAFTKALEGDEGPANEPRYYYHLGDSLLLLGRFKEAHEVHKRGAKLGHFLSPAQRSLYNVERLKSQPWWDVEKTPYSRLARALEKSWKEILKEGRAAQALYEKEKEGLKEKGEWSQLDLFARGREVEGRCARAPVTCGIVRSEPAASGCRRGQIKFSLMEAGTHVRPHVGPTNCRLRMHLGLSNTKDTYIRVDQETRQWQTGKVLMFDDSFEHEVWHNGTGARLVLIVDVWHPDLSRVERSQLPAI